MKRWSFRQAFALMLGISVALGMSLSVVQASSMAAKMAVAADMASGSSHGNCDGCGLGGGDNGAKKAISCPSYCMTSVFAAVLPPVSSVTLVATPAEAVISTDALLTGSGPPTEPYPPRTSDLS